MKNLKLHSFKEREVFNLKIVLKVPGHTDTTFESYTDINVIWDVLSEYPNCDLKVVYEETDTDSNKVNNTAEVASESIDYKDSDSASIGYKVPKSVTFTQRFQNRINKEVSEILNSVYPNQFYVSEIFFSDIADDPDNMYMSIMIKANPEVEMATQNLKYLDKNVEYILKDIIDYYIY